jgi:hypothetical protein
MTLNKFGPICGDDDEDSQQQQIKVRCPVVVMLLSL